MRLLEYFHDYSPQANPNPFRPKGTWTPPPYGEIALDTFLDAVEHDVRNLKPEPVRDLTRTNHLANATTLLLNPLTKDQPQ